MFRSLTLPILLLGALTLGAGQARAQLSIDYAETLDVTPSGFSVVWETSGPATPTIGVFADAAGTTDITDQFEIVFYPFQGDPAAADEIAEADNRDALRLAASNRGLTKVRLHGGMPNTTYHYALVSSTGVETASFPPGGGTVPVTTTGENSFVTQSSQILVTVLLPDPTGALMTVNSSEAVHGGLSAIVGDGAQPNQAYFNLNQLFQTADANWDFTGTQLLNLTLRQGGGQTITRDLPVEIIGGFAVAATHLLEFGPALVIISVLEPTADSYTTGQNVAISWEDDFPGAGAQVSLFYDTDNVGEDGTLIVAGLDEASDGVADTFDWDTTGVADGNYFVYAQATDGSVLGSAYGAGQITIDRNRTSGDGDSMSDLWEIFHFGGLARDGTADLDGDGSPDSNEFGDDTDPNVPDIRLVLLAGQNLIAFPISLDPALDSVALLQRIGPTALAISRVVNNVVETTRRLGGGFDGPTFPVVAGEGYHVELASDFEDRFEGLAVSGEQDLNPGVNLVGFPAIPAGYSGVDFLQAIGDNSVVGSVRRFNRESGRFETTTYNDLLAVGVDFPVERGSAYIVDMKGTVAAFSP